MPTIDIETNVLDPSFERRIAKAAALWLHQQGVHIDHVVTKFRSLEPSRVFSGPYPFDNFPGSSGQAEGFAFVHCVLARNRNAEFRRKLATVILEAAQPDVAPGFIFISFVGVDPEDYVKGESLTRTEKEIVQ